MREFLSNAVSEVWNNKLAYGLTTGATVARWALTAGTIDLVAESAGIPTAWRAVIATGIGVVTVSVFSRNRLAAAKKIINGSGPDAVSFAELTLVQKGTSGALIILGTGTLGISMVEVTRALTLFANYYFRNLGATFEWGRDAGIFFGMTPLTGFFLGAVLVFGYPEFVKNCLRLSQLVTNPREFNELMKQFPVVARIFLVLATLGYLVASTFQNQSSSNALFQNLATSIFIALLTAMNNAITYVGQTDENTQIVRVALNPGRSRLAFFGNTSALVANVAMNSVAKIASVENTAGKVFAPIEAIWADGLFNIPVYGPRVEIISNEQTALVALRQPLAL